MKEFYAQNLDGDNVSSPFNPPIKINKIKNEKLVVEHAARIAIYDDLFSAPRVITIEPTDIRSYLDAITTKTYQAASAQGGSIPFTIIEQVVENFIHAYFREPTISILDKGMTIRFTDQGPGIKNKDLAQSVGATSATREMKKYIRGVGSGLPTVKEYFTSFRGGLLSIEDNINNGTIVTISNKPSLQEKNTAHSFNGIDVDDRDILILSYIQEFGQAGPTDLNKALNIAISTSSRKLKALSEQDLVIKKNTKYHLTQYGEDYLNFI